MRLPDSQAALPAVLILAATVLLAAAPSPRLPAIVFVSRQPIAGERGAVPGLGPHQRAVVTGGRLLVRERDGQVRELIDATPFVDVSDPAVSPDARTIAFAAVVHRDSAWRIWSVGFDGRGLRRITNGGGAPAVPTGGWHGRFDDDLDPCWLDDSTIVFASTRDPQRAQYADVAVTNLYRVNAGRVDERPVRITAERNGAEEPTFDPRTGEIVFARWWFNRYRAADPAGITIDPGAAVIRDTVNVWQTMAIARDGVPRLAAADLRTRRGSMGYQPAVLADGAIAAVFAANLGLSPRPGGTGIHLLRRFGAARRIAGAIVSGAAGDPYGGTEGLAPPSACAPAALPDGRILFSYAPGARGDFGLFVTDARGGAITPVLDLPGTLELDAAPVVPRRAARRNIAAAAPPSPDDGTPAGTFRFRDLDVFADGPSRSPARGAAARIAGARIRFYATLPRLDRPGGDSAVLVREVAVGPRGEVDQAGLPAATPMFEQLIDAHGHVLMTAHGPAHVAGSNAGVAGTTTRCIGCHLGHSTLPVPRAATAGGTATARRGAEP